MEPLRDDSAAELVDPLDRSLAQQFVNFASTAARRAPLYSTLAKGIAEEPSLFRLLLARTDRSNSSPYSCSPAPTI